METVTTTKYRCESCASLHDHPSAILTCSRCNKEICIRCTYDRFKNNHTQHLCPHCFTKNLKREIQI